MPCHARRASRVLCDGIGIHATSSKNTRSGAAAAACSRRSRERWGAPSLSSARRSKPFARKSGVCSSVQCAQQVHAKSHSAIRRSSVRPCETGRVRRRARAALHGGTSGLRCAQGGRERASDSGGYDVVCTAAVSGTYVLTTKTKQKTLQMRAGVHHAMAINIADTPWSVTFARSRSRAGRSARRCLRRACSPGQVGTGGGACFAEAATTGRLSEIGRAHV